MRATSCSVVRGLPLNVRAVVGSSLKGLSNNRGREVTLMERLLGSTGVVVFSRTATSMSPVAREVVRRAVMRLSVRSAMVIVARGLSVTGSTSGVCILGSNSVRRSNARAALLGRGNRCCGLMGRRKGKRF